MKLTNLIFFNAVLFIVLGIAFALYGPLVMNFFGILEMPGAEGAVYWFTASFVRLVGAALFGYGFLLWAVRDLLLAGSIPAGKVHKVSLALLLANILGLFVAVTQLWQVWLNPAGWVTAIIFIFLTLGYAYFLVRKNT